MKLNKKILAAYAEQVNSVTRKDRRVLYRDMWQMYEGGGRDLILARIRKEFKKQDAVNELEARLVPINILKKVVNKSAGVYTEAPVRSVVDGNTSDEDLVEAYESAARINGVQKKCNRHLVMFRKYLKEFYVDRAGRPRIRVLAAHTYEVFNVSNPDQAQPDIICKIISDNANDDEQVLYWYTDESFFVTNGKGIVDEAKMSVLANENGRNPVKRMPFEFCTDTDDTVDPIIDEELLSVSICLPIVLTDLFFACKYQCWSLIYTVDVTGDINMNPSSVIQLTSDPNNPNGTPKIDSIKPTVDSDKVVKLVEAVLNMFLSARGLSTGTISAGQTAADTVSGVSKMLDNAEMVEGKKDQQEVFLYDESDMWDLLKGWLIPYWRRNRMLNAAMNKAFSNAMQVSVVFKEPRVMLSEKDNVEIAVAKLKNKLTSHKAEIAKLNPDWTEDMVEDFMQEIMDDELRESPPAMGDGEPIDGDEENGKGIQSKAKDKSGEDIQ